MRQMALWTGVVLACLGVALAQERVAIEPVPIPDLLGPVPVPVAPRAAEPAIEPVPASPVLRPKSLVAHKLAEPLFPPQRTTALKTFEFRLKNTFAKQVAADLDAWLKETLKDRPVQASFVVDVNNLEANVIVVPVPRTNRLQVVATEEMGRRIQAFIERADKEPKQYIVEITLKEARGDGEPVVIGNPTLRVLAGHPRQHFVR